MFSKIDVHSSAFSNVVPKTSEINCVGSKAAEDFQTSFPELISKISEDIFKRKVCPCKAGSGAFFRGKKLICNISGYNNEMEKKFGTSKDYTVLNIFNPIQTGLCLSPPAPPPHLTSGL